MEECGGGVTCLRVWPCWSAVSFCQLHSWAFSVFFFLPDSFLLLSSASPSPPTRFHLQFKRHILPSPPPTSTSTTPLCAFVFRLSPSSARFLFTQMSTKEKLISHVMKEEPVGCRNKVTVVGVGMVGMASAISVLLKVRGAKLWDTER